jgi:SWI/SNF-related matrix-associated actin-dependent regulator 1 of chromatin subfamily A
VIDLTDLSLVIAKGFLRRQPTSLSENVTLKEYQLIGLNWLKLLHSKRLSCILADEMGVFYMALHFVVLNRL